MGHEMMRFYRDPPPGIRVPGSSLCVWGEMEWECRLRGANLAGGQGAAFGMLSFCVPARTLQSVPQKRLHARLAAHTDAVPYLHALPRHVCKILEIGRGADDRPAQPVLSCTRQRGSTS